MSRFSFHPELFEHRTRVIEALSAAGIEWLSHYSSVDPLHDTHCIEVCGIHRREDAESVQLLLMRLYPTWSPG